MNNSEFEQAIICSLQRALLGNVTSNLRALNVVIGEIIILLFFYDLPPTEDELELANLTDTEFLADFPNISTNFETIYLPYPQKIPEEGIRIFERYE